MTSQRMDLRQHLMPDRVVDLKATDKDGALVELVSAVATSESVEDEDALLQAVRDRELLLSTGIGLGIAIPHARIPSVREFVVAVGRHDAGIDFGSIDGKPVRIVVLIAGPQDAQKPYLELLAQISKRLKLEAVREQVIAETDPAAVVEILVESGAPRV
jgi:mannitol/fructose-specific phosphotransferase system IIA component (Ntr-type)